MEKAIKWWHFLTGLAVFVITIGSTIWVFSSANTKMVIEQYNLRSSHEELKANYQRSEEDRRRNEAQLLQITNDIRIQLQNKRDR